MRDRGIDALVLLGNGNVVYATGASWPLLDAGLSHVERPVAVVLVDDEHPHLFMPFREGSAFESEVPVDHVHGPLYLEFEEGVAAFAKVLAGLVQHWVVDLMAKSVAWLQHRRWVHQQRQLLHEYALAPLEALDACLTRP